MKKRKDLYTISAVQYFVAVSPPMEKQKTKKTFHFSFPKIVHHGPDVKQSPVPDTPEMTRDFVVSQ